MGLAAENTAQKYEITREECDEYAYQSLQRFKAAFESGKINEEIHPITLKNGKIFDTDECPRFKTRLEDLTKIPPCFKRNGVLTPANLGGFCDGAVSMLLASEKAISKLNLRPLARIVGWARLGCDPFVMEGPILAIKELMRITQKRLSDVELFEINEAFSSTVLAVQKELNLDPSIVNVNGGSIVIGYPFGVTGQHICLALINEMRRRKNKLGVVGLSVGGGHGYAMLFENCN